MKRRNFLTATYRKEYEKKRFHNPSASKRRIPWRLFLMLLALFIAIGSIPFMLSYAPVFAFESITVEGLTNVPEQDVLNIVTEQTAKKKWKLFPQNNRFFFRDEVVFEKLNETYDFATLEIIVEGRTIHVKAEERINELVWIVQDNYYFLDLNGAIVLPLSDPEKQQALARINGEPEPTFEEPVHKLQPTMPIIHDLHTEVTSEHQQIVNGEFVSEILALDKGIRRQQIDPAIYEIEDIDSASIRLKTRNGYDVLFVLNDTESQLENLHVILTDYEEKLENLDYIDLRFGNHVYVK